MRGYHAAASKTFLSLWLYNKANTPRYNERAFMRLILAQVERIIDEMRVIQNLFLCRSINTL